MRPDDLEKLNAVLPRDVVFEMILTTNDVSGNPNAAPVGAIRRCDRVSIDLATETRSLRNLRHGGSAVLNAVQDPLIFAETAFNEMNPDDYEVVDPSEPPRIRGAAATLVMSLASERNFVKDDNVGQTTFSRLLFDIVAVDILNAPRPHARRFSAAIEAIIAVTKAAVAADRGMEDLLPDIEESVQDSIALARRTGEDAATEQALVLCERRLRSIMENRGKCIDA